MKTCIFLTHCCDTGRDIVFHRTQAWTDHDLKAYKQWNDREREHLKTCEVCNPDLLTNAMLDALWPGSKVLE